MTATAKAMLSGPARRKERGLTLLELAAAMIIIGFLAIITRLALNGITAEWRIRAAAHDVESAVRWAQAAAASRSRIAQVMYDVPEGSWWVRVENEAHSFRALPGGVRFAFVRFANGREVLYDIAAVSVFPDGSLEAHAVGLAGSGGESATLTFDRLTGEATYVENMSE